MHAPPSHAAPAADEPGFGLYVDWPFCLAKCPYCDFNSHVRSGVDQGRWRTALIRELDHYAAETAGRRLTSIFFGGGTPSLMPPETVAAVIERAARHWPVADEDTAAALFELTQDLLTGAGLPAYEISNHARPGAESRHNLTYWRYGDYVGVGPGAHGRFVENRLRVVTMTEK